MRCGVGVVWCDVDGDVDGDEGCVFGEGDVEQGWAGNCWRYVVEFDVKGDVGRDG